MHLENIPLQWVILKGFERDPFPYLAHSLFVMGDSLETLWLIDLYCLRFLVTTGAAVTKYLLLLGRTLRSLNSRAQEPLF